MGEMDAEDASTRIGAQHLAACIVEYWCDRGYRGIVADVIELRAPRGKPRFGRGATVFGIVSNIGPDGFPPCSVSADDQQATRINANINGRGKITTAPA